MEQRQQNQQLLKLLMGMEFDPASAAFVAIGLPLQAYKIMLPFTKEMETTKTQQDPTLNQQCFQIVLLVSEIVFRV
jgi:hypothetical protein